MNYVDDCIHLKACRRVQAIGRAHRLMVPRYCDYECNAYVGVKEIEKEIEKDIEWAFEQGKGGMDYIKADTGKVLDWLRGYKDSKQ